MESRARFWCFTSYDVDTEPLATVRDKCEYIVWGREICPTTTREHIQGFVAFRTRTKFSTVKRWIPGAHVEKCKGSPNQNADYCKKDGNFKEYGSLPKTAKGSNHFASAIELAKQNRLHEVEQTHPGIYLRYKQTLESLLTIHTPEMNNSCGIWIYGPPRCGKDFAVHQSKSLYLKGLNKWWDSYKGEDDVLISDVDKECRWLGHFLKIWADRYKFRAEIKGGSMYIRPKRIYVTSNYAITEVFEDKVAEAITARFNVYNFYANPFVFTPRIEKIPPTQVLDALIKHGDLERGSDEVDTVPTTSTTLTSAEKGMATTANEKETVTSTSNTSNESDNESDDDFQRSSNILNNGKYGRSIKQNLECNKRTKMDDKHK
uniref:Replication-associated protein n=1 Tax=Phylloscopus fuscatus CRESS-DNA-virus sp. TaxID=2815054 RepID=A0A8A4XD01_9VIRU|nr:MAG: replication-associated protein [Phylloscopus fuscatus CRESS-DNA-virus sp.]